MTADISVTTSSGGSSSLREAREQSRSVVGEQGQDELVLAGEVRLERAPREAGSIADVLHARAVDTVLGDDLPCADEQADTVRTVRPSLQVGAVRPSLQDSQWQTHGIGAQGSGASENKVSLAWFYRE